MNTHTRFLAAECASIRKKERKSFKGAAGIYNGTYFTDPCLEEAIGQIPTRDLEVLFKQLTTVHHSARKKQEKWASYHESSLASVCVTTDSNNANSEIFVVPPGNRLAWYRAHGFKSPREIIEEMKKYKVPREVAAASIVKVFERPTFSQDDGVVVEKAETKWNSYIFNSYACQIPPPDGMFYFIFQVSAALWVQFVVPRIPVDAFGSEKAWEDAKRGIPTESEYEMFPYSLHRGRCSTCGVSKNEAPLKKCSRCKTAAYCSKECQTKHWPTHKTHCEFVVSI